MFVYYQHPDLVTSQIINQTDIGRDFFSITIRSTRKVLEPKRVLLYLFFLFFKKLDILLGKLF